MRASKEFLWLIALNKMIQEWQEGNPTICVNSNYQDVEITKNRIKLISGIRGLRCDNVVIDEFVK